jgi:hypothetical protein
VQESARTSIPAWRKISSAKSYQEHSPAPARWWIPYSSVSIRRTTASARCPVYVGPPTWSRTTTTSPRSLASASIVSTKFLPDTPKSHEVRTMKWQRFIRAVASSPASFERPYAERGAGASDSTYGAPFSPSKT